MTKIIIIIIIYVLINCFIQYEYFQNLYQWKIFKIVKRVLISV